MLRATILFAVGLCANVLAGVPAMAQAPADVTLARIDCGTGATPTDVGQRFSDTFAYKDLKLTFTFSCYLIKHSDEYMVWDTGFTPGTSPNAPKVGIADRLKELKVTPEGDWDQITSPAPMQGPNVAGFKSWIDEKRRVEPLTVDKDVVHFRENYESDSVPSFNYDRSATVASIERMKQIAANLKATVVIQHDMRDIGKLPAFPAAAK